MLTDKEATVDIAVAVVEMFQYFINKLRKEDVSALDNDFVVADTNPAFGKHFPTFEHYHLAISVIPF